MRFGAAAVITTDDEQRSIVPKGAYMHGDLEQASGVIHIQGSLEGLVEVPELVIEEGGFLFGTCRVNELHVRGTLIYTDAIFAATIVIFPTGQVYVAEGTTRAPFHTKSAEIQQGAHFDGELRMESPVALRPFPHAH